MHKMTVTCDVDVFTRLTCTMYLLESIHDAIRWFKLAGSTSHSIYRHCLLCMSKSIPSNGN